MSTQENVQIVKDFFAAIGKVTKIREDIDTQALARASHAARSSNAQP